jgi:hypothetical protein
MNISFKLDNINYKLISKRQLYKTTTQNLVLITLIGNKTFINKKIILIKYKINKKIITSLFNLF